MKLSFKVKPNSKEDSIEELGEGQYVARVKAPAIEGRANEALIKLVSAYFDVPKSRISIIKGLGSRNKVVSIN